MSKKRQTLIIILGPTASGKTELALKLAREFNGFIISADSRQIYKEMNIGTAKPSGTWKVACGKWAKIFGRKRLHFVSSIPHFMIDIIKPNQKFTVAEYQEQVYKLITQILNTKPFIPLLVGGTGLYISSIVDGLSIPHAPPDWKLRKKIEKEIKEKGLAKIYKKLLKLDPKAKEFVQPKNPRRIIRALEVCLATGKPFSSLRKRTKPPFKVLQIGIKVPKEILYERINNRVDKMIKKDLVNEVKKLHKKSYNWNLPSMSGIGYKQIGLHLRKKIDLEEAIRLIKRDTRRFSRRQMTWFKKDKRIKWIKHPGETKKAFIQAKKLTENFLKGDCP